jgi:hypothetical protein
MSATNIVLVYDGSDWGSVIRQFQAEDYPLRSDDSSSARIDVDGFPEIFTGEINPVEASDLIINSELLTCFAKCMSAATPQSRLTTH